MIDRLREYWLKKSVKQRIYIIIFSVLMIAFFICIVKGNIIDPIINSGSESEQQAEVDRIIGEWEFESSQIRLF